jgi:hypothetical protein
MKKKIYKAPHAALVLSDTDIMTDETLPWGSGRTDTDGLAKDHDFDFEEEDWDDKNPWE